MNAKILLASALALGLTAAMPALAASPAPLDVDATAVVVQDIQGELVQYVHHKNGYTYFTLRTASDEFIFIRCPTASFPVPPTQPCKVTAHGVSFKPDGISDYACDKVTLD